MQIQKLTGPAAAPLKYDVLTALTVAGLNGSPTQQTSMMRLVALITARYNWRSDEVTVGQRDMARMWSVNERTVKREIKRLTESGLLICKRAGVRGRVAAYQLNYARITELTKLCWPLVGPDFDERMRSRYTVAPEPSKVVQLRDYGTDAPQAERGTWAAVLAKVNATQPTIFAAWIAPLEFLGYAQSVLRLRPPSSFFQRYLETHHLPMLVSAAEAELGPIDRVVFER